MPKVRNNGKKYEFMIRNNQKVFILIIHYNQFVIALSIFGYAIANVYEIY